jgi:thiamine-monophosphate kinase
MDEHLILNKWLKSLASKTAGSLGLLDDAALLDIPANHELVVTTDMSQEGIHFLPTLRGGLVANKVLSVNLSDLAAMGATPTCYQLALGLTNAQHADWLDSFAVSLAEMQRTHNIGLLGGDTIKQCAALTIAITAFGTVPKGQALQRTGAQIGDDIYVTGTIGDGAFGLALLQNKILEMDSTHSQFLHHRYWYPTPRINIGIGLRGIANSCMDISDGLIIDCQKLCAASGVGARLEYEHIPLSSAGAWVRDNMPNLFQSCISGGDDYELLFTAPADKCEQIAELAITSKTPITLIGKIIAGNNVDLFENNNQIKLVNQGYTHYSNI